MAIAWKKIDTFKLALKGRVRLLGWLEDKQILVSNPLSFVLLLARLNVGLRHRTKHNAVLEAFRCTSVTLLKEIIFKRQ
jgi:hypothetical protein